MLTIAEFINKTRQKYSIEILPLIELEIILSKVLNLTRAQLKAWPEKSIDNKLAKNAEKYCDRRARGEPIAYLFSEREFWSLNLYVDDNVLIPRHETENLIEYCVHKYAKQLALNCLDLGTGSGAIALALAKEFPSWHIFASDYSVAALSIAKKNREKNNLQNVHFICMDWLQAIQIKFFDLIVSNPPYIAEQDPYLQHGDLPFEPSDALIAKEQGLADLYQIITQAKTRLKDGGELIVEHGHTQGEMVRNDFLSKGYTSVKTFEDYAQLARFTVGVYCH